MNQTKNKSEKNKFSKLRLRSSSNISKQSLSPNPREKISSYFSLPLNESENQTQHEKLFIPDSGSQYAREVDLNDEIDFEQPALTKPRTKFEIEIQKNSKVTKTCKNDKKGLSRFINDQIQHSGSDTNQEHLQMALAMSKSLEEFENPQKSHEKSESLFPSTQEKISNIKRTLEQFGFESVRSTVDIPTLKANTKQSRKKFKFYTPILFIKTDEDRTKLLEIRVSQIISNIAIYNQNLEQKNSSSSNEEHIDNKPRSFLLRDYYDEDSTIFKKNYLDLTEMNNSTFYNKIISPEIVKTGTLLKNWDSIPGREKTPPLIDSIVVEETELTQQKDKKKNKDNKQLSIEIYNNRSISPELFPEYDQETNGDKINNSRSAELILEKNLKDIEKSSILTDKDNFSEGSETNSVSLLDNISPRRRKYKSAGKIDLLKFGSAKKKSLFINNEPNSVSLLDCNFGFTLSHEKHTKNISHCQEKSQIDHYESFCDNFNDVFDLTKSSDDSNDLFKDDIEIKSPINEKSHELFEDEFKSSENLEKFSNNFIEKHTTVQLDNFLIETQILKIVTPEKNQLIVPNSNSNDSNTKVILNKIHSSTENTALENLSKNEFLNKNNLEENKLLPKSNKDEQMNRYFEKININERSLSSNLEKVFRKDRKKSLFKSFSETFIGDKEKHSTVQSDNLLIETQILKIISSEKNHLTELTQSSNESNNTVILDKIYSTPENAVLENLSKNNFLNKNNLEEIKLPSESNKDNKMNDCIENMNKNERSLFSNLKKVSRKNRKKSLLKSFSETCIGGEEFQYASEITDNSDFFKLSSPLNVKSFRTSLSQQNTNFKHSFYKLDDEKSIILHNSTLDNINIASKINLSQSFKDIVVSDEESNYLINEFCKYKKSEAENKNTNESTENLLTTSLNQYENCAEEIKKFNITADDITFLSQSSIEMDSDISDDELNYSCNTSLKRKKLFKKIDEMINENIECNSKDLETEINLIDFNDLPYKDFEATRTSLNFDNIEALKHPRVADLSTPLKNKSSAEYCRLLNDSLDEILKQKEITSTVDRVQTPENAKNDACITPNSDIIIKTTNVTPVPDYSDMESPERNKELEKFGLKPMKRAKGIKILRYIYEATHPISGKNLEKFYEKSSDDEDNKVVKRRKKHIDYKRTNLGNIIKRKSNQNNHEPIKFLENKIAESENIEDMIFERKQSSRIYSCRIPLHIAWYNLVTNQRDLLEKISLYEPIEVEEIYLRLKSFGYKFHIQDIITFMDKKCITIRINQNRNSRKTGLI